MYGTVAYWQKLQRFKKSVHLSGHSVICSCRADESIKVDDDKNTLRVVFGQLKFLLKLDEENDFVSASPARTVVFRRASA